MINPSRFDRLISSQKSFSEFLSQLSEKQDWSPEPGAWSLRDIAAHMATVDEECHLYRIRRISSGEAPHFEYYLNTGRDFSQLDMNSWLDKWAKTREQIVRFIQDLPENAWAMTGTHETFGTLTIERIIDLILQHDTEHIMELSKLPPGLLDNSP